MSKEKKRTSKLKRRHSLVYREEIKDNKQGLRDGGFQGGSAVTNLLLCRRCRLDPWVRKIPWRAAW